MTFKVPSNLNHSMIVQFYDQQQGDHLHGYNSKFTPQNQDPRIKNICYAFVIKNICYAEQCEMVAT